MVVHQCELEVGEFLELVVPLLDGGDTGSKLLIGRTGLPCPSNLTFR